MFILLPPTAWFLAPLRLAAGFCPSVLKQSGTDNSLKGHQNLKNPADILIFAHIEFSSNLLFSPDSRLARNATTLPRALPLAPAPGAAEPSFDWKN